MDNSDDLFELGKIALQKQSDYLKLKIEKEVSKSEPFVRQDQLQQAHAEWQQASRDYRNLLEAESGDSAGQPGSSI